MAAGDSRGTALLPAERIDRAILVIRGHRVMLDGDLALLYGVSTRALNQAVKRNRERFLADFDAIRQLMEPPAPAAKRRIGFLAEDASESKA